MKKKVLIIILILTLAFIWGQSMIPKGQSANESGFVLNLVRPFLEIFVGKGNVTIRLVRKIAHFVEYSVLGVELALFLVAGWIAKAKSKANSFLSQTSSEPNPQASSNIANEPSLSSQILSLNIWLRAACSILLGFTVAAIDETIQIFSNRGPKVTDVLLDTAGVATAVIITTIVCAICKKK